MRVFIELAYDGTNYHGWQRQPEAITVQQAIEDALEKLFGASVPILGCGRTDASVHASYFVAHANLPETSLERFDSFDQLVFKLNGILNSDVAIFSISEVGKKAHARFDLREGEFDVLVGVNLLREGLDLPEVSLVAIMDADKEGFLRSVRSLTQTAGRAARNINGKVIMYADKITKSMQQTIDETKRRRAKQEAYNEKTGQIPQQIKREKHSLHSQSHHVTRRSNNAAAEPDPQLIKPASDPILRTMKIEELRKLSAHAEKKMKKAAKNMDYLEAARLRDEHFALENLIELRRK